MKGTNIGEFEELVLLTIGVLGEDAYGIAIKDDLNNRTGRNPSIGALHTALTRLGNKGYVDSYMEGPTSDRRGRRKRYYRLTKAGITLIKFIHEQRTEMIRLIPNLSVQ